MSKNVSEATGGAREWAGGSISIRPTHSMLESKFSAVYHTDSLALEYASIHTAFTLLLYSKCLKMVHIIFLPDVQNGFSVTIDYFM
jgi:hypothetical protein